MPYRRCGRSGLDLPAISLGLWHNFGDDRPLDTQRAIVPPGLRPRDHALRPRQQLRAAVRLGRDELRPDLRRRLARPTATSWSSRPRLATTCGRDRTATGARGSTCSPASTRASARMGLDYVDIFYSHRARSRHAAGGDAGRARHGRAPGQGALRRDLLVLGASAPREAAAILRELGTPLLIHQPSYSMLNRWIEDGPARRARGRSGIGGIAFSPLAQGLLTDRYLARRPGGLARRTRRRLVLAGAADRRRTSSASARLNEIAAAARPEPCAARAGLDAARSTHDLGADRREQRRAARRRTSRRSSALDFDDRRARGDRPLRPRRLGQPLGFLERRLTDELAEGLRPVPRRAEQGPRTAPPGRAARSRTRAPP